MDGKPQSLLTPDDRLGIERLPDTVNEAQAAEIMLPDRLDAQAHESADGRGRRIPDGHLLLFQDAAPAPGIEIGLIDDVGDAVEQGAR